MDAIQTALSIPTTGNGCSLFINVGNTCYLNSALQALMNMKGLGEALVKVDTTLSKEDIARTNWYKLLHNIYCGYWDGDGTIRPISLVNYLSANSDFRVPIQGDSTELLTFLIDRIHGDIAYPHQVPTSPSMTEQEVKAVQQWNHHFQNRDSALTRVFYGQYQVAVRCSQCERINTTYETFNCLPLQIVSEDEPHSDIHNPITLQRCFDTFHKIETLDGANKYYCDTCQTHVRGDKRFGLYWLPKYLIIPLKKYYKTASGGIQKSNREVIFPDTINVYEMMYLTNPHYSKRRYQYRLHSGIMHYGSTINGGHYNAFVRNPKINEWFLMDDESGHVIEKPPSSSRDVSGLIYELE